MPRKKLPNNKRKVTAADLLIGQRLRTRRMEQHVSQAELGDKLGVSFQQVQKYEKGVNRIGASRLQLIANILETDVDYFMGDMSDGKPREPSRVSTFMATKDGLDIVEAMMKLDEPHRRSVIALARTLGNAYGEAKA
jgi:transcriptional regulator with XRE-family HTH domain